MDDASARLPGRRIAQMLATVLCGAIGGFAVTRGLSIPQLVVSALAVGALAGAIAAPRRIGAATTYVLGVVTACVVLAAAYAGAWQSIGEAFVVTLPFAITAMFVRDRLATLCNAMLATIVGVTLGIGPAFIVLVAACLFTLASSKLRKEMLPARGFATYIASFSLVAVFINILFVT